MTEYMPKIFIGVLTYNYANFLPEALQSIINQSYTNWEVLICDDGSTDNTEAVIQPFLDNPKIKYFKQPKNCGQPCNWGYMISQAKGDYIATLHGDDVWENNYLESLIQEIIEDPSIEMICSNWAIYDQNLNPTGAIGPIQTNQKLKGSEFFEFLVTSNISLPSATIFSALRAKEVEPPDINLSRHCDREYFLRIARVANHAKSISEPLIKYRRHNLASAYINEIGEKLVSSAEECRHIAKKFPSISSGLPNAAELTDIFLQQSAMYIRHRALEDVLKFKGNNHAQLLQMSKELYNQPKRSIRYHCKELFVSLGLAWLIRFYRAYS
ncbi:MAG: glycosyltransferase [Methylococcaceae bacterium]|jgi:glycosyltransferase involved in cell wall biosynthesis